MKTEKTAKKAASKKASRKQAEQPEQALEAPKAPAKAAKPATDKAPLSDLPIEPAAKPGDNLKVCPICNAKLIPTRYRLCNECLAKRHAAKKAAAAGK